MPSRTLKIVLTVSLLLNLGAIYVGIKAWEYRTHINHFLNKYTRVVHEFAARDVHLKANRRLAADSTVAGRVVFVGTQVTVNWPLEENFPQFEAVNRGVFGQRLAGFPLRFYSDVIELSPEAVVVEISSFQFRPQYSIEENLEWTLTMIDLAEANEILPIIPTVIPPRAGTVLDEAEDYRVADSVEVFNRQLRRVLASRDLPVCDFAAVMTDSEGGLTVDLSRTAVDINEKGYSVMAEELRRVLHEEGLGSSAK